MQLHLKIAEFLFVGAWSIFLTLTVELWKGHTAHSEDGGCLAGGLARWAWTRLGMLPRASIHLQHRVTLPWKIIWWMKNASLPGQWVATWGLELRILLRLFLLGIENSFITVIEALTTCKALFFKLPLSYGSFKKDAGKGQVDVTFKVNRPLTSKKLQRLMKCFRLLI